MTAVLGVNLGHDRSACLLVDGRIACAIAEERLNRRKHDTPPNQRGELYNLLPILSVRYCLGASGLGIEDLDLVVASTTYVLDTASGSRRPLEPADVRWQLPGLSCDVVIENHHLAHAASAIVGLPRHTAAALLVVDGGGSIVGKNAEGLDEFERSSIFSFDGVHPWLMARSSGTAPGFGNSIGDFYMLITNFLGFEAGEEGKTMALASYGRGDSGFELLGAFADAIAIRPDGTHSVEERFQFADEGGFRPELLDLLGKPHVPGAPYGVREYAIAASAQAALETAMQEMVSAAFDLCGRPKFLGIAGGVALNCVANGRIVREGPFPEVFIQPAASDDGTALGDAVLGWNRLGHEAYAPQFESAYLGRSYPRPELVAALERRVGPCAPGCEELADDSALVEAIVEDLSAGEIVALFRGRSEFGPRALGHRSILCDPRSKDVRDRLNVVVKHREMFRPFAPIVLASAAPRYFGEGSGDRYMLLAGDVTTPDLPAVTHVDRTARVQLVYEDDEPFLAHLLESFAAAAGVPVLLNTSFNDTEPIVETPDDALNCFEATGIDVLYLERHRLPRSAL